MENDKAIVVDQVSKDFKLPHERAGSVKSIFTGLMSGGSRKTIETQHALKSISFEIKKGEFFGIVGRNGSGKSTMLKMLAGIYQPSAGRIQVNGKLVPFIELGVGFNPELTGRENVYLNGAMLGFSEAQVDSMYHNIVDFAEIGRFMDQKLKNYSSGMQVRLAFSIATRAQADILLVDEVLAVGDADFQRKCFDYFRDLKKNKKTVVFVSHDMSAIQQFCDQAVLIEDGKIIKSGSSQSVAQEYSRLFLQQHVTDESRKNKRWGDGAAKHARPKVHFSENNDFIEVAAEVKSLKDIDNSKLGFSIKDGSGRILFGTNTTIIHTKIKNLKAGEKLRIIWKMPNILNSGEYTADLTISYSGIVAEWWEDAVHFSVNSLGDTPYIVNPPVDFRVEQG